MKTNPYQHAYMPYHINTSMENKIIDAYLELSSHIPHQDITISQVCQQAKIARTTFYYYFDSLRDVLDLIENNFLSQYYDISKSSYLFDGDSLKDKLVQIKKFMEEKRYMLGCVFTNNPDHVFIRRWEEHIKYNFYEILDGDELKLSLIAGICLSTYRFWLDEKANDYESEIEKMMFWIVTQIKNRFF